MNKFYCYNCGNSGHLYKYCHLPIISNGIICYTGDLENIKFLMIRRRYTIGYTNFIRGQYELNNTSLLNLINIMTIDEKQKLINNEFEFLWKDLWITDIIDKCFENEYKTSNQKFNKIKPSLHNIIKLSSTSYKEQEWGFPKGKRDKNENNLNNAIREFEEETNLTNSNYKLLNLKPIIEDFMGTDNKKYRNNYYVAKYLNKQEKLTIKNSFQKTEISDIKFLSFEEMKLHIRPYHKEKIKVIESLINSLKFLKDK